jgi:hypothetical protein
MHSYCAQQWCHLLEERVTDAIHESLRARECYQEDEIKWEEKGGDKISLILGTVPVNPGRMAFLNWTATLLLCGRDKSLSKRVRHEAV